MAGYCGKLLRINLSKREISKEDLDLELAKKFVGGRGLGTYFMTQEVDAGVEPFSPENKIIFATGPLTASQAPTAGRYMVVTKSPLSGTIASSNSGGFWGAELKHAGYDLIIVEGKADKPCYISIKDDTVEIKDAQKYWGKLVSEATELLGKAKVPNLPYTQPNKTPYRIDTDWFGKKRNISNPFPGPFEPDSSGKQVLKVRPTTAKK